MGTPPDPKFVVEFGFVVEWQLTDDPPAIIDLTVVESEVVLPDEDPVRATPAEPR